MWHWQKRLFLAVLATGAWVIPGAGPAWSQQPEVGQVPDAARKAVARRQEMMEGVRQRLNNGDRLLAGGDAAGAYGEYRAAFLNSPGFAIGHPLQVEAFSKYQTAARRHAEQLAEQGRLDEGRTVLGDVFKDARDGGVSPKAIEEDTKRLMADLQNPEMYNPAVTTSHVSRVKLVEKALKDAEGAFRIGDFDAARKHYSTALTLDPTNSGARRGLEMVEDHVSSQYLTAASDHTRAKMLGEVGKSWESVVPRFTLKNETPSAEMLAAKPAEAGSVQEKLRSIIVPDVEFVDTPLREALVFLSNRSRQLDPVKEGVNIILKVKEEAAANKPVTISLRGAPLETVIDYVGQMTGMEYRVDNFAVTVVPLGDLSSSGLIIKNYQVPPGFLSEGALTQSGDPFSSGDPFASPEKAGGSQTLQPKMGAKDFLEKHGIVFPPGGAAQFNPTTGTLMVRNTQDQLDLIEVIVQNSFGNVTKLLRIEVKGIEIGQDDLEETGFDWLLGAFGVTDRVQMGGGTFTGSRGANTPSGNTDFPLTDASGNPIPGMPVTGGLRSGNHALNGDSIEALISQTQSAGQEAARAPGVFSVNGTLTNPQFASILRAVNQHKGVDELLSSHVVVRAGQTATIKNVREFIYPTEWSPPEIPDAVSNQVTSPITPANPEAFEAREVGAQMQVVECSIDANAQTVHLTVTPEVIDFSGFVNYGSPIAYANSIVANPVLMPVFSTKRTTVTVDVYDGHTLVIAGLLQERVERVNDKVPLLGDAPFVGSFFRQKSEATQKRALVFFVTPRIVDPGGGTVSNFAEKTTPLSQPGNP